MNTSVQIGWVAYGVRCTMVHVRSDDTRSVQLHEASYYQSIRQAFNWLHIELDVHALQRAVCSMAWRSWRASETSGWSRDDKARDMRSMCLHLWGNMYPALIVVFYFGSHDAYHYNHRLQYPRHESRVDIGGRTLVDKSHPNNLIAVPLLQDMSSL